MLISEFLTVSDQLIFFLCLVFFVGCQVIVRTHAHWEWEIDFILKMV